MSVFILGKKYLIKKGRMEVIKIIIKECERRMREDYNQGRTDVEIHDDEIAQGCMASMIYFLRSL